MTNDVQLAQRIAKFSKVDQQTGEVILDTEAEKKSFVERSVYILKEIDMLKEDISSLVDEADDKGYEKKEVKALIKYAHKNSIEEEIEKLEEIQVKLGNMFGGEDE